ncbi:MAG TPA: terminase large subunit, partial [Aggregatilineaceae bacterium]|nr:terminase large subunit [Aggregatilineaceae bacterium]
MTLARRRSHDFTIVETLRDPNLFGGLPAFRDLSSWSNWVVLLKAIFALPLTSAETETFTKHTGRSTYDPPPGGWQEIACIVGRQSGKSRIASLIAAFEAMTATPEADRTDIYALLVAQDARAALRTVFSYAKAPFEMIPILKESVMTQTAETLRLSSGVVLAAYPCRPAAVRGLRARVVVCDELAFFRSTENLPQDVEMLRALRPTLATTNGKLIILSSPYGQTGALWDLHRKHFGRNDSPVLIWQGSAPEMNSTLSIDYLQRMEEDDPESYRAEVLGEFRAGISMFLDPECIQ